MVFVFVLVLVLVFVFVFVLVVEVMVDFAALVVVVNEVVLWASAPWARRAQQMLPRRSSFASMFESLIVVVYRDRFDRE